MHHQKKFSRIFKENLEDFSMTINVPIGPGFELVPLVPTTLICTETLFQRALKACNL
jgi:hypothetical protein